MRLLCRNSILITHFEGIERDMLRHLIIPSSFSHFFIAVYTPTITMSSSRRSLLAALWSIVGLLTLTSFVIAVVFAYANQKYDNEYAEYNNDWSNDNKQNQYQQQGYQAVSVTSRAMVFAAIWTAVLSGILVIYGTVILGVRMPTGKYYACCAGNVHRMTPVSLGAFGGSLLMFANLTLVCAILFGEFEVRVKRGFMTFYDIYCV